MTTPSLSIAKRQALAVEAAAARIAALKVPSPFTSYEEFRATLEGVARSMVGGGAELARHCKVDTSTVAKWLRRKAVPTQENLEKMIAWWRLNRDRSTPMPVRRSGSAGAAQTLALTRLSQPIQSRLQRTAKLRNLTPIKLAEQILDRHLPSADQLDKETGR
jgi:transcriptional regulator with XRE-family HTH domain